MTRYMPKLPNLILVLAAISLLIAGQMFTAAPVAAGELELTDIQNAKLARHRAKERVMKNEKQEDYLPDGTNNNSSDSDDGDCGTVDIGNVVNNKGFGGPKAIDVIITGDIINANNKCN